MSAGDTMSVMGAGDAGGDPGLAYRHADSLALSTSLQPWREFDQPVDFDTFVRERGQALWRQAWLLTRDGQLAEDLVQTAFAKTWRRYQQLGEGYEPYLRRTIYTTYVSWWHRKWRGEVPTERMEVAATQAEDLQVVQRQDLVRQLATLSKMQRAVIVLRYVEDLSEAETADTLGISVGSVKTHASRGLKALRAAYPNSGVNPGVQR